MGQMVAKYILHPDTMPDPETAPTFDPMYGFPAGRKPRVMLATEAEMKALRLPKDMRDYCAHLLPDYVECTKLNFPFVRNCSHELHAYHQCEYDDYIMRSKEYERERRLLERQKRKQMQQPVAA